MTVRHTAPNHIFVSTNSFDFFVSYRTPVAVKIKGEWFRTNKKWSTTTSKHINAEIGKNSPEIDQSEIDKLYDAI